MEVVFCVLRFRGEFERNCFSYIPCQPRARLRWVEHMQIHSTCQRDRMVFFCQGLEKGIMPVI